MLFFSQKGNSWFNIIFTKFVWSKGKLYKETYNYILVVDGDGTTKQDCSMVIAMIDAAIEHFKKAHDHVTSIFLKSDNASNLKNEWMIRYLSGVSKAGRDPLQKPLTVEEYLLSIAQDGKDEADLLASLANSKIRRVVSTGVSINTPKDQAQAICEGTGLANCIVMLGDIVGSEDPIPNKQIPTITNMHQFRFKPGGVNIRRVAGIGPGLDVDLEPLKPKTKFVVSWINESQLKDGIPIKQTSNPANPVEKVQSAGDQQPRDPSKKLSANEFLTDGYIQTFGMGKIQEFQPEVNMGGKSLLQKLDLPVFSENLLSLQTGTQRSNLDWTLNNLKVGHALPVWGSEKNKKTLKAKEYLAAIYNEGVGGSSAQATEVYQRMQEETDPATGEPLFNADTYLDVEQIKSHWTSCSKPRKAGPSTSAKRQAASAATAPEGVLGLDFVDDNNGIEQQVQDEAVRDMGDAEEAVALERELMQIEDDLDNYTDPIMVVEENLCQIAEKLNLCIGKPLKNLSLEKKQAVINQVEPDVNRRSAIVKNSRMLTKTIVSYVRMKCPNQRCGFIHK